MYAGDGQEPLDLLTQRVDAFAGVRGHQMGVWSERGEPVAGGLVDTVDFVEHKKPRNAFRSVDVGEDRVDRVDLGERVGVGGVDHVDDDIGVGDFF